MKRPATSPLATSSAGKDTSLLSKAPRDLSGASNLKDKRVGHYLATWVLSCPVARRQFNNTIQYVNATTFTQTTGEACKAAVEAYAASLSPPTAMCELVLNMRSPKSSWRTLSELYMPRKLEYHRTVPGGPYSRPICTERDFQARWKELVAPVQLDEVLPKATGISWPFASLVRYILSPAGLGAVNQPQPPIDVHRPGGCLPRGRGRLDPTHHLLGQLRPLGPLPRGPLGVEHGQLR